MAFHYSFQMLIILAICCAFCAHFRLAANAQGYYESSEQTSSIVQFQDASQSATSSSSLMNLAGNNSIVSADDISTILSSINFADIDRNTPNASILPYNIVEAATSASYDVKLRAFGDRNNDGFNGRPHRQERVLLSTSRVSRPSPTTMEVGKASATIEAATIQLCRSAGGNLNNAQTSRQVLRKLRQVDLKKVENNDIRRAAAVFNRFNKRQKFEDDEDGQQREQIHAVDRHHDSDRPKKSSQNKFDLQRRDFNFDNFDEDGQQREQIHAVDRHHDSERPKKSSQNKFDLQRRDFNFDNFPSQNNFNGFGNGEQNGFNQLQQSGPDFFPTYGDPSNELPQQQQQNLCFPSTQQYRTADGTNNNLQNSEWGRQNSLLKRLHSMGPHYDGDCNIKEPRMRAYAFDPSNYRNIFTDKPAFGNRLLPNARLVSNVLMNAGPNGIDDNTITHMVMQWGQFVDHDLSLSPLYGALEGTSDLPLSVSCVQNGQCLNHPECICICNTGDVGDKACLDLRRSAPGQTSLGEFREQINELTAYMDGSQVYGSSDNETLALRARFPVDMGLLKVSSSNGQEMLPVETDVAGRSDGCQAKSTACYAAGDVRVNTHIGLASMQTLWLREHNRIARQLKSINPRWNGERVFQETRRIIGALLQRITYGNWLPIVLGQTVMNAFGLTVSDDSSKYDCNSYQSGVEAATLNEFATAAFRFGHSLVENDLRRRGIGDRIRLSDTYFDMSVMKNEPQTCNSVLGGLSDGPAQKEDNLIANVVRNELFKTDGFPGHDLPARSIQRGRDHGQPGYAFFAWACKQRYGNLGSVFYPNLRTQFDPTTEAFRIGQISLNKLPLQPSAARLLKQAGYVGLSAADMDLFPAGISEVPVREMAQGGGLVGPTFACIIAEQFRQLKRGDRFFYTNPPIDGSGQANTGCAGANAFTPCQLRAISRQSLAHVLCANGAVAAGQSIQRDVFRRPSQTNSNLNCANLQYLDLSLWQDGARCNEPNSCQ